MAPASCYFDESVGSSLFELRPRNQTPINFSFTGNIFCTMTMNFYYYVDYDMNVKTKMISILAFSFSKKKLFFLSFLELLLIGCNKFQICKPCSKFSRCYDEDVFPLGRDS